MTANVTGVAERGSEPPGSIASDRPQRTRVYSGDTHPSTAASAQLGEAASLEMSSTLEPDSSEPWAEALFGREAEIHRIVALIDRPAQAGGILVLRGDPGIGKSALLDTARAHAAGRGWQCLQTGGAQTEAELPFAGLQRLLKPLLDRVDDLPERQRSALLGALDVIEGFSADLFLVALGALTLLTEAAAERPLLILVDDAQWLDSGSADVLAFIARRARDEQITMLAAIRDGYRSPLLEAQLDELLIAPLDEVAAELLLNSRASNLTPAERQRVLADSGGNPLAVIEFSKSAGFGPPHRDWQLPGQIALSERLERTFAARAAELPEGTRLALLVIATDDRDVIAEVIAATSRVLGDDVDEEVLAPAIDVRLIRIDGIRISFANPLVRSAIYQVATEEQRRKVHAALAEILADEPDRAAWHRASALSAPNDAIATELERVADRAERRGAIATAAIGLQRAAILSTDPARRVDRLLRAADIEVELGRTDVVSDLLARVAAEDLSPLASARAASIRDRFDDRTPGDAARILGLVQDARRTTEQGEADLALALLLGAAWRTWWTITEDAIRDQVLDAARNVPVDPGDPRLLAVYAVGGPVTNSKIVSEQLATVVITPDDDPGDAYLRGLAAHTIGQSELAVQVLAGAAATMRTQGRLGLLARVLTMEAWSTIQLGSWTNVETLANESTRLSRETGQPLWAAGAQAAESAAAGIRGDFELAARLADQVEAEALPRRLSNILCVLQVARGITALGAGRYADAYDHLVRVFDPTDPAYHFAERHGALGYLAEASVHVGRAERARELLRDVERIAASSPAPIIHLGLLYGRPLLGEAADAEAAFLAALEADIAKSPFFRARVQLAYGGWLRRQRRVGDSRSVLRHARDAFDAIGARPWGDRAREQLRASGEASNGSAPSVTEELTPQQRQIAEMTAAGMTNREIADQLFLSPRTVASHLYRIFPKLGIVSRAELADALARVKRGDDGSQDGHRQHRPSSPPL